jgi:nicotinamidase-related amidase
MAGMTTALLLVDAQRNMLVGDGAVADSAALTGVLADLLGRARAARALVVHVRNDGGDGEPDARGTDGWELVLPVADREYVIDKDIPDAFAANPILPVWLREHEVTEVVVAGLQSEHCVSATARAAKRLGLRTVLAAGAHATYDDGEPAADIVRRVEAGLAADGIDVTEADAIRFTGPSTP